MVNDFQKYSFSSHFAHGYTYGLPLSKPNKYEET